MANDLRTAPEPSMASLVSGIVSDAQDLFKQELALAKREMADELRKTRDAAISFGVGIGVAALGGWLLVLMVVYLLHEVALLPLWASYLIVGGVMVVVGCILFFVGRAKASSIHLVPQQTVETMKENVRWIKNQT